MYGANAPRRGLSLRHALAGLEAGVLGALVMLACLGLGSALGRRSVWLVPNLLAATFLGNDAYQNHWMPGSLAGAGIFVAIYGALGAVWGCVWRERRKPWLIVYGAIFGALVYYVLFGVFWKRMNGLVALYAPGRQLEVGHVLWGMVLARSPRFARRIAEATAERYPVAVIPEGGSQAAAEVRSGEVIR